MSSLLHFASALGADAFVVQRAQGQEVLGRLPRYQVSLLAERPDLPADRLLGTNATLGLALDPQASRLRYFNGHVTHVAACGAVRTPAFASGRGHLYEATLHPALWFLGCRSDCRIHRDIHLGDLLAARLAEADGLSILNELRDSEHRDHVVQYRETDLAFVSRLAEHIGAWWRVVHVNGAHSLVLTDRAGAPDDASPAVFLGPGDEDDGETLERLDLASCVVPGAWAGTDHHPVTPRTRLDARACRVDAHDNAANERFDAPLGALTPHWADAYARMRLDEVGASRRVARGVTRYRGLHAGYPLTVRGWAVDDANGDWLVTSHAFEAVNPLAQAEGGSATSHFRATFEAVPLAVAFRPERLTPTPRIAGTQSARVVADFREDVTAGPTSPDAEPVGEKLARVRVAFDWDRRAQASCRARVAQPWAGRSMGFQNMPRLGDEVLVQFLEGDPDRPVVVGRVWNGDRRPPYELPRQAAVTGLRTASLDAEGGSVPTRFQELRFDDTLDAEQVFLRAQRDLDVRVLGAMHETVAGARHGVVAGDRLDRVAGDVHASVTGDAAVALGGALSLRIGSDLQARIDGGRLGAEAADEIHLRAGVQVVIEAAERLTLKVGGSVVDLSPAGVRIDGPSVSLRCGGVPGQGHGASPSAPRAAAEAMDGQGGPPPAGAPPPPGAEPAAFRPGSYRIAADVGVPFCTPCDGC